jgi:hypothetical protein
MIDDIGLIFHPPLSCRPRAERDSHAATAFLPARRPSTSPYHPEGHPAQWSTEDTIHWLVTSYRRLWSRHSGSEWWSSPWLLSLLLQWRGSVLAPMRRVWGGRGSHQTMTRLQGHGARRPATRCVTTAMPRHQYGNPWAWAQSSRGRDGVARLPVEACNGEQGELVFDFIPHRRGWQPPPWASAGDHGRCSTKSNLVHAAFTREKPGDPVRDEGWEMRHGFISWAKGSRARAPRISRRSARFLALLLEQNEGWGWPDHEGPPDSARTRNRVPTLVNGYNGEAGRSDPVFSGFSRRLAARVWASTRAC